MSDKFEPVTHVIFDMDGLLLDTEPRYQETYTKLCARYGKEYTLEAQRAAEGRSASGSATQVISILNLPLTVPQFLEEMTAMYPEAFGRPVRIMPGAERLVKHLKENKVPICIATSSEEYLFQLKSQHYPEFFRLFDHIVKGSDPEVKRGKPEPDIFLVAAKQFEDGGPKQMKNVLVFEDSVNGVQAGLSAGMQVCWVPAPSADKNVIKPTLILDFLEQFQPEVFGLPAFN